MKEVWVYCVQSSAAVGSSISASNFLTLAFMRKKGLVSPLGGLHEDSNCFYTRPVRVYPVNSLVERIVFGLIFHGGETCIA